jgi:hypothetical protein
MMSSDAMLTNCCSPFRNGTLGGHNEHNTRNALSFK